MFSNIILYNTILYWNILYIQQVFIGQWPTQLLKQAGIFCPANQAHTSLPQWRVNPKMSTKSGKPTISKTLKWGCQIVNFLMGKNDTPQRFQRCQPVRNLSEASCQSFLQLPISVPQWASSSLPKNGDHQSCFKPPLIIPVEIIQVTLTTVPNQIGWIDVTFSDTPPPFWPRHHKRWCQALSPTS